MNNFRISFEHLPPIEQPLIEEIVTLDGPYRATIDNYRTFSSIKVVRKEDEKIVARVVFWKHSKSTTEPNERRHEEYVYDVEDPRQAAHDWYTSYYTGVQA